MAVGQGVERQKSERAGGGRWNYARLREFLVRNAYDPRGNCLCHSACLARVFSNPNPLGKETMARTHAVAIAFRGRSDRFVRKSAVNAQMRQRVVVPLGADGRNVDANAYLESLEADDLVEVMPAEIHHGNAGNKHAGLPYEKTRGLAFRNFVRNRRSSTGRTADAGGRYHGALYYLDAQWTAIRKQNRDSDPADDRIFSVGFISYLEEHLPTLKATHGAAGWKVPGHDTVAGWLKEDFGLHSTIFPDGTVAGHTVKHAHKTDACSTCCKFDLELQGLRDSRKGYIKHKNIAGIEQCDSAIADIEERKKLHVDSATAAKAYYRNGNEGARASFVAGTAIYNEFIDTAAKSASRATTAKAVAAYAKRLARVGPLVFEHDYKEDSGVPAYHASAQPGPVFFMSHATFYVHVVLSPSLGEPGGPSRLDRNHVYTRAQTLGPRKLSVSKGSDDTASTVLSFLLGETLPLRPSVYRTGYDADGPIR